MNSALGPVSRVALRSIAYFLILIGLEAALGFDRGFGYDNAHLVGFNAQAQEIMHSLWPTDFALYIRGAELIPTFHLYTFTGSFGMYPPGLSYIEYGILKLWPNAPLYAVLFFLSLLLWAIFLGIFSTILHRIFLPKPIISFAVPLALLAFPFFSNDSLWSDVGLTECIASPLFAIACVGALFLLLFPIRRVWIAGLIVGLIFAIAAYIRAQFDLLFTGLAAAACLSLFLQWATSRKSPRLSIRMQVLTLLAIILAYQGATIPYKIFKHAPTIISMDSFIWGWVWTQKADVEKYHVMADKGMQSICEIEPEKCQEFTDRRNKNEATDFKEYKRAAFLAVAHHPVQLLEIKLPIFWKNWKIDMFEAPPEPWSYRWFSEYLLVCCIPLACAYGLLRHRKIGFLYIFYATAFIISCLGFSIIVHIEARYFLPVKLLAATSLIFVVLDIFCRRSKLPNQRL